MLRSGDPGFRKCQLNSHTNHAPPKTVHGIYCSQRCKTTSTATPNLEQKPRIALSSKANVPGYRECDNPPCDSHSPLGVKYGRYCSKVCKTADEVKQKLMMDAESKRVTNTSDLFSPCTRISCSSTKVQAGIWGSC